MTLEGFTEIEGEEGHVVKRDVTLDGKAWEFIKEQMREGHHVYYLRDIEGVGRHHSFADTVDIHILLGGRG